MKVIYLLSLLGLALTGCSSTTTPKPAACSSYTTVASCPGICTWTGSSCQATPTACSDITDATFCSVQALGTAGCYWTGSACTLASTCTQPTSAVACGKTTVSGKSCYWSGSACSSNPPPATCSSNTTLATCQTANCFWTGTTCIASLNQCSDITDQTLCSQQAMVNGGCYWTGNACSLPTACIQPTTSTACLGTKQSTAQCEWNGSACYLNNPLLTCAGFKTQTQCQATSGSDGYCFWNTSTSTCTAATSCAQLTDAAICTNAPLRTQGALCNWTPATNNVCVTNSSIDCQIVFNIKNPATSLCCAGQGNQSCTQTDANCQLNISSDKANYTCGPVAKPVCTYNGSASLAACCSGTGISCTSTNPNCTYAPTVGGCS